MSRVVKSITFDAIIRGKRYHLDFGYHNDPAVTDDYIHSEDGPWSMIEVGDAIVDFQIYATPDNPDVLKIQACMMIDVTPWYWSRGSFLSEDEFQYGNIEVEYND